MIARIWHGRTPIEKFEDYTEFLLERAKPDYESVEGFHGLTFLRKVDDGVGHFLLITYWKDLEVIRNFAGSNILKAKYYEEDEGFLLEFEEQVQHYEVFASKPPKP